jgi:hypothetical protein
MPVAKYILKMGSDIFFDMDSDTDFSINLNLCQGTGGIDKWRD